MKTILLRLSLVSLISVSCFGQTAPQTLADIKSHTTRCATFNASLNRFSAGQLIQDLSTTGDSQAQAIAETIQRVRPDILLLNEFDYDQAGQAVDLFQINYLSRPQGGAEPIFYPYVFVAPSNTGVPSVFDLDNDGNSTGPGDAFGFAFFPGQFGMVVLSRYPILHNQARSFQNFLWKDMPGALLPDDPATAAPADWYSAAELNVVRLSSKSHWDVPVDVNGSILHVLAAHPTPPVFDGPEDRNGRRNYDEIRFWADYVDPSVSAYIVDDAGISGGLDAMAQFVVMGDYNSDPNDGDSVPGAMNQLLNSPRVNSVFAPRSGGAVEASAAQGIANAMHLSSPLEDTSDFGDDPGPGNLRVDYVLPSLGLPVVSSGVYWPLTAAANSQLVTASDHRMVHVDLRLNGMALRFLGQDTLPTGQQFMGTEIGGLSGLVYLPAFGAYVALSDDRSSINPARYYGLTIDLSNGQLNPGDVQFGVFATLMNELGVPYPAGSLDPEGLALTSDASVVIVSSEGDTNAAVDPFVNGYQTFGSYVGSFPVPSKFLTGTPAFGVRNNLAFESLCFTPSNQTLLTATENGLFQDGPAASLTESSPCRILSYSAIPGQNGTEVIYQTDTIPFPSNPPGSFATHGLVDLQVLRGEGEPSNTVLLSLERSFSVGVGNEIRIYAVSSWGADDVSEIESLTQTASPMRPVKKELLLDLATLGIPLDNIEGMTFGPVLPSGQRSLVLVSDNNFSNGQFTQFLAFELPTEL